MTAVISGPLAERISKSASEIKALCAALRHWLSEMILLSLLFLALGGISYGIATALGLMPANTKSGFLILGAGVLISVVWLILNQLKDIAGSLRCFNETASTGIDKTLGRIADAVGTDVDGLRERLTRAEAELQLALDSFEKEKRQPKEPGPVE